MGSIIVNPERSCMYVPIPKCATNSLRATFPEWRAEDNPESDIDGFAIVRNPIDRWFSGIAEATFHHDPDRDYDSMLDAARGGKFVWDNHTRPQVEFVRGFDHVALVKLEHAADYVLERFGRKLAWERSRRWNPASDLYDAIRSFYSDDVELYERAR